MNIKSVCIILVTLSSVPALGDSRRGVNGRDVLNAGIIFKSEGNVLKVCVLRHPTGDEDVNEAICGLVERCIAERAGTDRMAACIKPRIAKLASLIDSGLLFAPAEPRTGAASEDIVVTAKSLMPAPSPGRWVFVETGRRTQIAGGDPNKMLNVKILQTRQWHQCVKSDAVVDTLAMMLRQNVNERDGSPCGWTVDIARHQFNATQRCTIPGALIQGALVGANDDKTLTAYKTSLIHSLTRDPTLSTFRDASSPSMVEQSRIDPEQVEDQIGGRRDVRGVEYQEDTEIKGHLIGSC